MKRMLQKMLSRYHLFLLDFYSRTFPDSFIRDESPDKSSPAFSLYVRTLSSYASLLEAIRQKGPRAVEELQRLRLRRLIRSATRSAWWKKRFSDLSIDPSSIRERKDLLRIPPLSRSELTSLPSSALMTATPDETLIVRNRTSGSTTGSPIEWAYPKRITKVDTSAYYISAFKRRGFPFERFAYRNFFIHFNYFGGGRVGPSPGLSSFTTLLYLQRDDGRFDAKLRAIAAEMTRQGGCVLRTNPSELFFFVQQLKERGLRPPILMCSVVGQVLEEKVRLFVEDYLRCPVIPFYGTQETLNVAVGCIDRPYLLHVNGERAIVEILDERGNPVPPGETGEITITCLDTGLMPLIRYQPGDRGALHPHAPCTCGNPTPLLSVEGRSSDIVPLRSGTQVSVRAIASALVQHEYFDRIARYQIRHETPDSIRILIEALGGTLPERATEGMRTRITSLVGEDLHVRIEVMDAIPLAGMKFRVFVPLHLIERQDRGSR